MAASDKALDLIIEQSVDLDRLSHTFKNKAFKLLETLEKDILKEIRTLRNASDFKKQRLNTLLKRIKTTMGKQYEVITAEHKVNMAEVAKIEAISTARAINTAIGASVIDLKWSQEFIETIVDGTLIFDAEQDVLWRQQYNTAFNRLNDKVKQTVFEEMQKGLLSGATTDQIVKKIKGTKGARYKNGELFIKKRNAETLILTGASAVANKAAMHVYRSNDDIIKELVWISVLDRRTTEICRAHSGLHYQLDGTPIGHSVPFGGGPPAHYRCRSRTAPVFEEYSKVDDTRFKQSLKKQGFSDEEIRGAKANMQASMDGQSPREMNYEQWLRTKSPSFQREIMGVGKWQLWKAGKLKMTDLLDNSGNPLSLEKLKKSKQIT